jgi:uncharacterized membrane protein (UPF0127 family)
MKVKINNDTFKVKLAISDKERANGMMKKRFDDSFDGMLFMEDGSESCFWMKNCIINLDIIFIKNNKISKIHHDCPPCTTEDCDHYCGIGDFVLELPGGSCKKLNISEGNNLVMLF